jgi:MarR family transcriptional repressor of emrRAB
MMSRLRTANLLAALAGDITERAGATLLRHPNQTDSFAAALNVIGFWDGITNAELARVLKLSHTATVRLVDKLEGRGLVESRSGPDKRATHFHLTDAGKAEVGPLLVERCVAVDGYLDVLSESEQTQLNGLLEKLMRPLAVDGFTVSHFCRLCDDKICPGTDCPMHKELLAKAGPKAKA